MGAAIDVNKGKERGQGGECLKEAIEKITIKLLHVYILQKSDCSVNQFLLKTNDPSIQHKS